MGKFAGQPGISVPESFVQRPYAREHFAATVAWARLHHPFYQRHIPDPANTVPILTRAMALANNDALLNGHPPQAHTSGSTGFPLATAWSPKKAEANARMSDRLAQIMGGPLPRVRLIRVDSDSDDDCFSVFSPLKAQADFLLQRIQHAGARCLVSYPTNATALSRFALEQDLDLRQIERVVCFSESFDDNDRDVISEAFPNARIWSTYSCKELGMLAWPCPHEEGFYHTNSHDVGFEVLDDDDRPCENGRMGRLVMTDYINTHMPFIRYDIGDMVVPGDCPCGKFPGPAFTAILGRRQGSLKLPDGERLFFSGLAAQLRHIEGLLQYQVVQHAVMQVSVRLVIDKAASYERISAAIRETLLPHFGPGLALSFSESPHIEREPSGKFQACVSHV